VYSQLNNDSIRGYRKFSALAISDITLRILKLVSNPLRHRRVFRAINSPEFRQILPKQPEAARKYLLPFYLTLDFNTAQRADAFCYHYEYVRKHISEYAIRRILNDDFELWSHSASNFDHRIALKFSNPINSEGELTVEYAFNNMPIYLISFTIINGHLLGLLAEAVCLVTRIQGTKNNLDGVRQATKSLNEIAPAYALMSALQGFLGAFGIKRMIGVSADQQVCAKKRGFVPEAYVNLYEALGGIKLAELQAPMQGARPAIHGGYYSMSIPTAEKPISLIKQHHRSRTLAKRRRRKQIRDSAFEVTLGCARRKQDPTNCARTNISSHPQAALT
jgi:uncharacterized protein VirK/YbjX